ncbi:hypothetical protein [Haloechinothrix salitolerans]|uniref:Lsr2 protein n=1 Tax=Haloechinothrix salitolerans TaxID=926830 RepID=A0ABW2BSR1_9PSEU
MSRIAHVTLPAAHYLAAHGPEWVWRGVFGDDTTRLTGVPAGQDAPACVALYVCEDIDPRHGVTAYLDPADAHDVAGAVLAAAHAATSNDPGSAGRTAKNDPTEPGLPGSSEHSTGRRPTVRANNTFVGGRLGVRCRLTRRDRVSYTPRELNRLITSVTAREIAGRLRQRADWHREAAHTVRAHHPDVAGWHRDEAAALDALANHEEVQR